MGQGAKRYIRLSIKRDVIEETHSEGEISFEQPQCTVPGKTKTFKNTLRFIPCVEIFNNPKGFATEGIGEFDALANHIVRMTKLFVPCARTFSSLATQRFFPHVLKQT
jgi:hypothetical protein